jgi:hypothetical protein
MCIVHRMLGFMCLRCGMPMRTAVYNCEAYIQEFEQEFSMTSGKQRTMTDFMDMVKEVDEHGEGLNQWEIEFIASFIDQPRKSFTEKQWEVVERLKRTKVK